MEVYSAECFDAFVHVHAGTLPGIVGGVSVVKVFEERFGSRADWDSVLPGAGNGPAFRRLWSLAGGSGVDSITRLLRSRRLGCSLLC